jgi:hypothetical protein
VTVGRVQNTGRVNPRDYRGKGIEHMALDLELGRVGRQHQVLQEGNTH